jgi:holin-like protein
MIEALFVLFVLQLIGEVIARVFDIPVPGPVLGMLLLFAMLTLRGSLPTQIKETSQTLLKHLSLLFVPAGVGIMKHYALIQEQWLLVLATLLISTIVTIAVTALTTCAVFRRLGMAASAGGE